MEPNNEVPKFDPNAPAFSQKVESPQEPEGNEANMGEGQEPVNQQPEGQETPVPYSRFRKFHEEATRLRAEVEELRKQVGQSGTRQTQEEELPQAWKDLYGDTDASLKAWKIQQEFNERLLEQAREEVRNERTIESQRIESNIQNIDEQIEDLSSWLGRDLTNKEESEILDIVDEYTPKDASGNYAGALIPFDKAWEIYELRNQTSQSSRRQSRDSVARLSASQSEGEPTIQAERDKNFNPMESGAWRRALGR